MDVIGCPSCRGEHPADADRCPETGERLPRQPRPATPPSPGTPLEAPLALRLPSGDVVRLTVGATIALARTSSSPLARADKNISRSHAEVTVRGGGEVVVVDVGSRNGTYVNGEELPAHIERRLEVGDVLQLANDPAVLIEVVDRAALRPDREPPP